MLKIEKRTENGTAVLDLRGRIVLGQGTTALRDAVREELDNGSRRILLNFAEVSYVDSAGFGELLGSYTTTAKNGGEMKLCGHQHTLMNLMHLTKLNTSLQVFADESEALQSFAVAAGA